MGDTFTTELAEALEQLVADILPVEFWVGLNMVLQGASLTELSNNVAIVGSVEDVE